MTRIYCVLHTNEFTEIYCFVNCFFCCQLYSIHLDTHSLTHVESKGPNESEDVESKGHNESEHVEGKGNSESEHVESKGNTESEKVESKGHDESEQVESKGHNDVESKVKGEN